MINSQKINLKVYTWNLYDLFSQCHPAKFNFKKVLAFRNMSDKSIVNERNRKKF